MMLSYTSIFNTDDIIQDEPHRSNRSHEVNANDRIATVPMIGYPATHTHLPTVVAAHTSSIRMPRLEISPSELGDFVSQARRDTSCRGFVSTAPHKAQLVSLVDELTETSAALGLCNVVERDRSGRLRGGMTDGAAAVLALDEAGYQGEATAALIVGSGAAGLTIADSLISVGVTRVILNDIDPKAVEHACSILGRHRDNIEVVKGARGERDDEMAAAILVNASTLGLSDDDAMPFEDSVVETAAAVIDVTTKRTRLQDLARRSGRVTISGRDLAHAQLRPVLDHVGIDPMNLDRKKGEELQ